MIKLYDHQQDIVDLNPPRWILGWDCRLGKTIGALELAKKNNVSALIVVPKHLRENWLRNIASYPEQDHIVVTKEELRSKWDSLPHKNAVIGDESHLLCGSGKNGKGSQLAQALQSYLKKHSVEFRWYLSATPLNSQLTSAYMLMKHLGKEINYWGFIKAHYYSIKMGHRMIPKPMADANDRVSEMLRKHGTFLKMEEIIDLPEESDEIEYFELHPEQTKAIKELDTSNPLVRFNKLHQCESFGIKGDEYVEDKIFKSYKLDRIMDLVEQNNKVVIFCKYRLQMRVIKEALLTSESTSNKEIFEIHGDVKNRDEVILNAEKAKKAVIIINTACSTGYELASFSMVIFASLPWNYVDYYQCRKRVKSIDPAKIKKNIYITLLNTKGLDEDVKKCLDNKEDFHLDLFLK